MKKSDWVGLCGVFSDIVLVIVSFIARRSTASKKANKRDEDCSGVPERPVASDRE